METLDARIRTLLDEKSMLQHPFYQAWSQGTLPKERLQEYARQYYHFEAAFPRMLSAIHARCDSASARQLLLSNLWDEEIGARNHVALWLEFGKALGVSEKEIRNSTPNAETRALVDHFSTVAREAPVAEGLATLFAYEGQVPSIAWEKIKGLREHYGLQPNQFEFFSVHLISDVSHAGAEMDAIRETCEDEDGVVSAASASCDRLLGFLDGCYATAGAC